jgi:hypothetical protein
MELVGISEVFDPQRHGAHLLYSARPAQSAVAGRLSSIAGRLGSHWATAMGHFEKR